MCMSGPSYSAPSTEPTIVEKRELLEETVDEPTFRFQTSVGGDKLGGIKSKGTKSLRKKLKLNLNEPTYVNTPQAQGASLRII